MKWILLLLLIPIALLIAACSPADDNFDKNIVTFDKKPQNYPGALVLLPNASRIRYYELAGGYQLMYHISVEYPANTAITAISDELKRTNWTPLSEDYLNPGSQSSHVRGWSLFVDNTKNRPRTVHQWLADWENQTGDILTYGFRYYQYKASEMKDLKDMTVIAIFTPVPLARACREAATSDRKTRAHENK